MYCYSVEVDWKFTEIVWILFGNLPKQYENLSKLFGSWKFIVTVWKFIDDV